MPCPCSLLSCTCGKHTCAQMRHILATILIFGNIVSLAQRVAIHIAIVEMVFPINATAAESNVCPKPPDHATRKAKYVGHKNNWSERDQSIVLLAYFVGYVVGHIPASFICDKYPTYAMVAGCLLATLCTAVVPIIVTQFKHYAYTVAIRIVIGLGQAVFFPSATVILTRWIPKSERSTISGAAYSAVSLGIIVGTLLSGLIIEYMGYWEYVFYFWGCIGILWIIIFCIYVRPSPSIHGFITEKERELLQDVYKEKHTKRPPIKLFLSDFRIWALLAGQFSYSYINVTIQTYLPKYIHNVLHFNMKSNALISSLPYLAQFITGILCGRLIDYLISKNYNVGCLRKIYTFIAVFFPSVFLLLAGYSKCNQTLAVACFSVAIFFGCTFNSGLKVNIMDMSINYAGFVMAFINGLGLIAGICAPYVNGAIVSENTFEQWNLVFLIVFCLSNTLCSIYILFGTGKRRKWDYDQADLDNMPKEKVKVKWYREKPPPEDVSNETTTKT